jgi:lysozyme
MMTPEILAKLRRSLITHEGYSNTLYKDTVGKETIGIGYNISDRGLPDDVINKLYLEDISYFYKQLNGLPWFEKLNWDRQIVLIDMCFMGWKRFLSFRKMISYLEKENYTQAAFEMLDSKWADQVKGRAVRLANAMITGIYNI